MLFLNRFNGLGTLAGGAATVLPENAAYWRINVTLNNQGAYTAVAITDITWKNAQGDAIVTNSAVFSASAVAGGNTAAKAYDGTSTTNWASTGALPQWIDCQFLNPVIPYSVDIKGNNSSPDQAVNAIKDFDIQYSTDGISYTTIASYSGETAWATNETRNFVVQAVATSGAIASFDSGDISASVTLADSDRTIVSAAANFLGARTIETFASGKYYCECTSPAISSGNILVGFATSGFGATGTAITSATTYYAQIPGLYRSGTLVSGWTQAVAGDVIGIAIDVTNTLLWISINGVWQAGDPSAGTGGYDYSSYTTGAICFVGCMYANTEQVEFNFGQVSPTYPAPTGFTYEA